MSMADFAQMKDLQRQITELVARVEALEAAKKDPQRTLSLPNKDKAA
jgi:hypothetical protein